MSGLVSSLKLPMVTVAWSFWDDPEAANQADDFDAQAESGLSKAQLFLNKDRPTDFNESELHITGLDIDGHLVKLAIPAQAVRDFLNGTQAR